MIIGRHPDCEVVLDSPLVSRRHARLEGNRLVDLASANGTFVDGQRVESVSLEPGQIVYIGPARLRFDGQRLHQEDHGGQVEIQVQNLVYQPPGASAPILNQLTLSIKPGEFVALVGTSGAGKSTLMKCLSGQVHPSEGAVLLSGLPAAPNMELFRSLIGWVPQDDIVHSDLEVEAALRYAARLRLPGDTSAKELQRRLDFVLASMNLAHRRSNLIKTLSGGERKRVSIAVELLTEPSLFFLDEPTSGLDPGLEKRAMQLLSRLSRQGRTVVLVTHATQNIVLCDRVCFLAPGGRMVFYGTPHEALEFFRVDDFAEIYLKIGDSDLGVEWERRFRQQRTSHEAALTPIAAEQPVTRINPWQKMTTAWRQFGVLLSRYTRLVLSDHANLALLVLQAPAIGLVLANLFGPDLFALQQELGRGGKFPIHEGPTLLFMLVVSSLFFGAINSSREIVKELPILRRERHVNLMLLPYLASKVIVLFSVGLFQCAILQAVVFWRVETGLGARASLEFYTFLVGAYLGGVAMGLFLSAVCGSAEQSTTLVSVLLILQLVLSGAFVKPEQMGPVIGAVSILSVSRWSFAGTSQLLNINNRFMGLGMGWITGDFYLTTSLVWSVLAPLLGLHLALVYLALRWREGRA
ncbi:MAG: ATP-binding cassette domain-containing protein [Vulcanimicrobiota bacterium]